MRQHIQWVRVKPYLEYVKLTCKLYLVNNSSIQIKVNLWSSYIFKYNEYLEFFEQNNFYCMLNLWFQHELKFVRNWNRAYNMCVSLWDENYVECTYLTLGCTIVNFLDKLIINQKTVFNLWCDQILVIELYDVYMCQLIQKYSR